MLQNPKFLASLSCMKVLKIRAIFGGKGYISHRTCTDKLGGGLKFCAESNNQTVSHFRVETIT